MRMKSLSAGFAVLAAVCGARAAIVTNSETLVISTPTTLTGVTNIYTHTTFPAQIDADLTLDKRTYLRFMGANTTGVAGNPTDTQPVIKIATTPADVKLTMQGNSMFAATYRNSTGGDAWKATNIDPPGNGNAAPSRIRVHLGVPDGEPGSTGSVKIDLKTNPSFGGNVFGSFWAEYLYINTSVKPNDSGYIDFLDVASGITADISYIDNLSDTPARILFNGGLLLRNNALARDAPLAPATGHELILEGRVGSYAEYCKQYAECNLTARRGGIVRFRGPEARLRSRGNCVQPKNFNFLKWKLAASDNIVWEQTGQLYLMENCFLVVQDDDVLPHAAFNGQIRFHRNTGNRNNPDYRNHCVLDVGGTVQHVNGLVSDDQDVDLIGVVTNDAFATGKSLDRGTIVFGEHDFSSTFNARCETGVDVRKIGTGKLTLKNASGESLALEAGTATFTETCSFGTLTVAAGINLVGAVRVRASATFAAGVDASPLSLSLDEGATISAASALEVNSLAINGVEVAAGVYTTADWLVPGSAAVTVVTDSTQAVSPAVWTGAGADNSATTVENWQDASSVNFANPVTAPEFATSGSAAVFPAAISFLGGLTFNAAGDFTLSGADPANSLALYGDFTLGGSGTRTYTVDMPMRLSGVSKTITVPASDVTLHLRDLSGVCAIDIQGEKLSALSMDYSTNGVVILDNPRTEGDINHNKGGGTVVLRGEVGVPGDSGTYTLDYGRYRNNSNSTDGWAELGKTRIENVVFHKKFQINGAGQLTDATGTSTFLVFGGATNVFNEKVTEGPSCSIRAEGGTVNIFEKGFGNTGGTHELNGETRNPNAATAAKPAVFVFNGPISCDSPTRPLQFASNATRSIFNCTGNYAQLYMALQASAKLEFTVDDAFTDTDFYFVRDAVVDLGGTHQKARNLMSNGTSESASNYGIIQSTEPATFEVTLGAPSREACAWVTSGDWLHTGVTTNSTQQFTGPVSLVKSGAGYLFMNRNGTVNSTGDVKVKGGSLEFAARTSWPNVGAVTAEGTGALVLNKADTFGQDVALHLAGSGTVALPSAAMMRVGELWLDDAAKPAPSGVYGAVGDTGATHTTAHILSGRIKVPNLGTRVFLR